MTRRTPAERFAQLVDTAGPLSLYRHAPGPCHLWTGTTSRNTTSPGQYGESYGAFWADGRAVQAHRYAYEQTLGPIPDGHLLDHRCRRRNCCNPEHLEPVDNRTNTLRGTGPTAANARKTQCDSGHDLTDPANVYRRPTGGRTCRVCRRGSNRAYKARQRTTATITPLTRTTPTRKAA